MTVKQRIVNVLVTMALVLVVLVLWWGFNQKPEATPISEYGVGEVLVEDEAARLAKKLMSQDEATYAEAWSHDNMPPSPPNGTTIVVNAVESGEGFAVVDVTITMPDPNAKPPEEYYLLTQFVNGQWRIYTMEEVI